MQAYDADTQAMQLKVPPAQLLAAAAVDGVETELQQLPFRSGAELTFDTMAVVRCCKNSALSTWL